MKDVKNKIILIEVVVIIVLIAIVIACFIETINFSEENLEIEKKWLIKKEDIPYNLDNADKYEIVQTYISFLPEMRVRKINNGEFYILTLKRDTAELGFIREEYEVYITEEEYNNLLTKKEGNTIHKTRYQLKDEQGLMMAIDIFSGDLEGLAYLEIEFENQKEATKYETPDWLKKDVTIDLNYKNGHLARYGIPESYYEYIK